ncbi:MAG: C25 family cysteine peptidase [Methanothrix sp.]|nr:C25 family cysteine peptidase [Methanothrix sp.]
MLLIFLILGLLSSSAQAQLERGVKGEVEDVILLDAQDWHSSIAATPLAIYSEDNRTITKPLLILPKEVDAGKRMGWVEQRDLDTYGVNSVLHTFKSANISSITIHGKGDEAKALVEAAHKEGMEAYITATLELPTTPQSEKQLSMSISESDKAILEEAGFETQSPDQSHVDPSWLQVPNSQTEGKARYYCPTNPEVRDYLYSQVETLVDDYKTDGVVLYRFGYQDDTYCFCNSCKEKFYKDTGIDLTKVYANNYNLERWNQWKQQQITEIVNEAKRITADMGPVELGVAMGNPFDRSQGYNFAQIAAASDFTIISPVSKEDAKVASSMSPKPVYIRLSDDYVGYILSTQNVEGTVKYLEDLTLAGAEGIAFEYNVVYTPIWSELQPPSPATQWLLQQLGGKTLGIGNVSWEIDAAILAHNSSDMAAKISERWMSSPGAVIAGENYSAALSAAPLASYLNWPILFADKELSPQTSAALKRLNVHTVILAEPAAQKVRDNLTDMNITILKNDQDLLLKEMKARGENASMVVLTNSRDFSLLPLVPKTEIKRAMIGDVLAHVEISPSEIPAEEPGQIVRLNVTLTNSNTDVLHGVFLSNVFPNGKLIQWPRPSEGEVNITDPYTGLPSDALSTLFNGSLLRWGVDKLEPGKSATLNTEVELQYAMDSGWRQQLDGGFTISYDGLSYNHTIENKDDWPIVNITYPTWIYSGRTNISWNLARESSYTALNLYSPNGRSGSYRITDIEPDKLYVLRLPLLTPGKWKFNIEAGDGYTHRTQNYTIEVRSNVAPLNITSSSHTKVPRLSLVAAQAAAAHKGLLVDVATDPQKINAGKVEDELNQKVNDLQLAPQYLIVVGDPGSLPFISTGLKQKSDDFREYSIYRDYQISNEEDNYTEVASGRIMGLSVYDASQLLARTLAYDRLAGAWKNNSLVISSPPLSFPQAPVAMSIRDYLLAAGLNAKDLRYEEATYQQAVSQMNNGQNIVHFHHHGFESGWALSFWSMMDPLLTEAHVKQILLSPQTTTTSACVTMNLKGFSINVSGTEMYIPMRLEDSIALAFLHAGAVNYVGESALSWIFVSDDYGKKFYQALVFDNASIGQAQLQADNLYKLKFKGAENIKKNLSDYDDTFSVEWDTSVREMLNQTAYMGMILGDPSFRPALPKTPPLPYTIGVQLENTTKKKNGKNLTTLKASVNAQNESATDWIYWIETDTTNGKLALNAPPAIIASVSLPKDADKIVVKEDGRAVWHDENMVGDHKIVMWPVIQPRLGDDRNFEIEYMLVPGQVQTINITAGWNAVSVYLDPKNPSVSKYLKSKPFRGIFAVSGDDWDFSMNEASVSNVTTFSPGEGYLIDSAGNFSVKLAGKPVDTPYQLKLHPGWNMIGLPLNETVNLNNLTLRAEYKRYNYSEAVEKGIISAFLWKYDENGWIHLGENETLVPGKAYLLEVNSEAKLEFG